MDCFIKIRHDKAPQTVLWIRISGGAEDETLFWEENPPKGQHGGLATDGGMCRITAEGTWSMFPKVSVMGKTKPVLTITVPSWARLKDLEDISHGPAKVLAENSFFKGSKTGLTWRLALPD
ncbi:hypothetical protein [Celeribacter neptunius]|uniref:Uncharacterized protein n=1 Tax=Celeribacter neptunius TaxID=588602 RepID=A0A1I3VCD6_9RHOB|nr:hypothetical protein [Celeribacter neptunius]SFJ92998.1 hypothetical protein SAMN04487991_3309 [Celeribacter neptunius]